MFGVIGLAVLSSSGRSSTHPARRLASSVFFVVIEPTDFGATTVVAPVPDAESLAFYPLVLKLVVCVLQDVSVSEIQREPNSHDTQS